MRLQKFRIKNYKSIIDTGIVSLSEYDNISVLAGQNESGKSSILEALDDFGRRKFKLTSIPFCLSAPPSQSISCTYQIEDGDDFSKKLSALTIDEYKLSVDASDKVLDENKLKNILAFTITRTAESGIVTSSLDEKSFNIFRASILNKPEEPAEGEIPNEKVKFFNVDESHRERIADLFWNTTPNIVYFDDFCDLLPDKIFLSDLAPGKENSAGYRAVKNLEKIININFSDKDKEIDSVRGAKQQKENENLSVDFQQDWGQRIHGQNKVTVKYDYQKRDGIAEFGSYINFYVETKEGQPLPPKQRSKGLIWFLSLWLELKAQDIKNKNLVLLLDEPDQHLHVRAQKDILKLIEKLASSVGKGNQIIYATHSPYLIEIDHLNRIKLILNTEDQGTKIEDIVTSKIDTDYKRDALQPIANAIGLSVSDFSTIQKKDVILEGVSDYYYFSAMKKIMERKGDYHFLPGIGVRQINNLISLCIGYGLDWIAIIDDDPSLGGKDSRTKLDEIRDYVFDGDEEKAKQKVYILEGKAGIENMFSIDDLKLVNVPLGKSKDMVKAVGQQRKVLFSKMFFEKANSGEITQDDLSGTTKENFLGVFNFIEKYFGILK